MSYNVSSFKLTNVIIKVKDLKLQSYVNQHGVSFAIVIR